MNKYIRENICQKKIVLVDCFDTLLYRECTPNTVLIRWLGCLAEKYNVPYSDMENIWKLSIKNTDGNREELRFEDTAKKMYVRMSYYGVLLDDFIIFYNYAIEKYIDIEAAMLNVNRNVGDLITNEKIKGKRVYLVSDFYMPRVFFVKILEKLDVLNLFDGIYISSEVGLRKSTGSLYSFILDDLNVEASDVVMIGDNKHSDYKMPKAKGMTAVHLEVKTNLKTAKLNSDLMSIFEKNLCKIPLSNYAYTIYLFMYNILQYVEKNHVQDLYFCSREGEFLKRLFDAYILKRGKSDIVNTHYILVSRQATFVPSLNVDIKKEYFITLRRTVNNISIRDFLDILGLSVGDLGADYGVDKIIPDFFNSSEFSELRVDNKFSKVYTSKVLSERREFESYLKNIGISINSDTLTLVDIGWRGTIQDNIYNFFDGKLKINGLYYGLEGSQVTDLNNRKYGLVYSDVPVKDKYFDIFTANHRMLERILYASHGSARGYRNGKCVLSELDSKEKKLYELMQDTKNKIEDMVFSIDDKFAKNHVCNEKFIESIATLHEMYLCCYTDRLYKLERSISGLMSMTFGTQSINYSYKKTLKNYIKASRIEQFNKFIKMLRRLHCGLLCDVLIKIVYLHKKKHFLKMEI